MIFFAFPEKETVSKPFMNKKEKHGSSEEIERKT